MLEKLFTSRTRVKLLNYFLIESGSGKTREISKQTRIPVSAVSRELKNLLNLSLVKKERDLFLLNNDCNFIDDLRNIFIKTDGIVYPIRESLKSRKIEYALIFGSFARGDYKTESDVDLFILGNVSLDFIIKIISSPELKIKRNINPVVWRLDDLKEKKRTGFVKDVFAKKIIMLKGDENELRKIIR